MKLIKGIYKFFDKKIIVPITKLFVNIGGALKKVYQPLETVAKTKSSTIIISLVIALAIFIFVDGRSTTLLETNAKVLYNQPVSATYNDEEYVVEGLPETVDITMIGTKANLYLAKQLANQVITVDLSDLKVGTHQVELKYKQPISNVEYKLDPSSVRVTIKNKQSITKELTEEIVNLDKLDTKYSVNDIQLVNSVVNKKKSKKNETEEVVEENEINSVVVKGSEEKIKEVSIVKALINISDLSNDLKTGPNKIQNVPLVAYDKNGEILDVELVPSKVDAKINLESNSKEVPIEVVPKGLDNIVFGKAIASIDTNINKVSIYGSNDVLDTINKLTVDIDVTDLKDNKTYTKTIKVPKGVREISNKTVTINVKLGDESSTELSGVKLSYKNLNPDYVVQVTQDSTTEIPVILKGVESVIKEISATDIDAYVDLKGLDAGEHTVDVLVTGNDNKVIYKPKVTSVKIIIIKK